MISILTYVSSFLLSGFNTPNAVWWSSNKKGPGLVDRRFDESLSKDDDDDRELWECLEESNYLPPPKSK